MIRRSKSIRGVLAGGALALAAMLAGCTGIPTSGPVMVGKDIDEEAPVDIGILPSGPRAGATQQEILLDFVQAATDPQSDYRTARQFLAASVQSKWNPDASVAIRRTSSAPVAVDATTMDYTITTSTRIDADGHYVEDQDAASQTLTYGFVKEGGQWRISQLADGIVLSEDNFDVVFSAQSLYFFDPTFNFLVPDLRFFPNGSRLPTRIASALVKGQDGWLGQGVSVSEFPSGTSLGNVVTITCGVATVDLSNEVRDATNLQLVRMRQQLAASLAKVSSVSSVVLTNGGVPITINDSNADPSAITEPRVDPNPLVRTKNSFGFAANGSVAALSPMDRSVISLNADAATLASGKATLAIRAAAGVYAIRAGGGAPQLVDDRSKLVEPSVDTTGFIWSAQSSRTSSVTAFDSEGGVHGVDSSTLPRDGRIVSMDVSRDGARILFYLVTPTGPRLVVAGIIRQKDNVPDRLGAIEELPVDRFTPIDAAWAASSTVATLSRSGTDAVVTAHLIGGPSTVLGRVSAGRAIVGGTAVDGADTDGLRVLSSTGEVYKPRGSSWQRTGISASLIAVQQ